MKLMLRVLALAMIVFGVLWALQGLGILMWPPHSFMLASREWGLYGAILAGLGVVVLLVSTRIGPRA